MNASDVELRAAPSPVDVHEIERELDRLWLASQEDLDEPGAVTRACMSNLVVYCDQPAEQQPITQDLAEIAQSHPARVLLLLVEDRSRQPRDIEAYVSALCHGVGQGKQVCCEHVAIHTRPGATARLASATRSLLIGDLPTSLWWASREPPMDEPEVLEQFAPMCQQLIYDSRTWSDVGQGLAGMSDWLAVEANDHFVSDLRWHRLRPWRRVLSQSLDPQMFPRALEALSGVTLEHGPTGASEAWLLVGWLAGCLGWIPARADAGNWRFQAMHGPIDVQLVPNTADDGLARVSLQWHAGGNSRCVECRAAGNERLELSYPQAALETQAHHAPHHSRAALVARILPELWRDGVFRGTLAMCRNMLAQLVAPRNR